MPMETFWKDQSHHVTPSTSVSSCPARVPAAGAQPDLGGEVLLSGEGLSERTEAMLDQIVQITWEDHSKIRTSAWLWDTSVQRLKDFSSHSHQTCPLTSPGRCVRTESALRWTWLCSQSSWLKGRSGRCEDPYPASIRTQQRYTQMSTTALLQQGWKHHLTYIITSNEESDTVGPPAVPLRGDLSFYKFSQGSLLPLIFNHIRH